MTVDDASVSCGDERSRRHARQVLRRVGDAWSLVLVAQLIDGPLRFNALLRAVDGISHRMLTQTLRSLERDGLVSRTSYPETPPRVEYTLTDLGRTLVEPVLGLVDWVQNAQDEIDAHRDRFDQALG